jgi:uncharacterized protein YlzI (FlbEa/FlbD family)
VNKAGKKIRKFHERNFENRKIMIPTERIEEVRNKLLRPEHVPGSIITLPSGKRYQVKEHGNWVAFQEGTGNG